MSDFCFSLSLSPFSLNFLLLFLLFLFRHTTVFVRWFAESYETLFRSGIRFYFLDKSECTFWDERECTSLDKWECTFWDKWVCFLGQLRVYFIGQMSVLSWTNDSTNESVFSSTNESVLSWTKLMREWETLTRPNIQRRLTTKRVKLNVRGHHRSPGNGLTGKRWKLSTYPVLFLLVLECLEVLKCWKRQFARNICSCFVLSY